MDGDLNSNRKGAMTGMHGTIVITKKPGPELTYLHEWAGGCSTIASKLEVRVPRAYNQCSTASDRKKLGTSAFAAFLCFNSRG